MSDENKIVRVTVAGSSNMAPVTATANPVELYAKNAYKYALLAMAYANADEDMTIEEFLTNNNILIQGEKGEKGEKGDAAYTQGNGIVINGTTISIDFSKIYSKSEVKDLILQYIPVKMSALENDIDNITRNDIASSNYAGVVKIRENAGITLNQNNACTLVSATQAQIDLRNDLSNTTISRNFAITPNCLDYAVVKSLTSNSQLLSDEDKVLIQQWIGIKSKLTELQAIKELLIEKEVLTNSEIQSKIEELSQPITETLQNNVSDECAELPEVEVTDKSIDDYIADFGQ